MTNKLVVIINSLKVPKIKKILLYEMKFLVRNYSCLQKPWPGGYRPKIPVLCPQLNLLKPPPRTKFVGTPLVMDVRSRGVFHLSGVLVYFILKSVVVVLHANLPTFLSYHKLTAVHGSELLYKCNTPDTLWPHRNSDFRVLLVSLYQAIQTLSQSMKPELRHHAETKLYCSHGNADVTHSVSNQGYVQGRQPVPATQVILCSGAAAPVSRPLIPRDPVSTSLLSSTFFLPQQLFSKKT